MKLESKLWGVPLIGWIVGGVFVWLLLSGLGRKPIRRRDTVSEVVDGFETP